MERESLRPWRGVSCCWAVFANKWRTGSATQNRPVESREVDLVKYSSHHWSSVVEVEGVVGSSIKQNFYSKFPIEGSAIAVVSVTGGDLLGVENEPKIIHPSWVSRADGKPEWCSTPAWARIRLGRISAPNKASMRDGMSKFSSAKYCSMYYVN